MKKIIDYFANKSVKLKKSLAVCKDLDELDFELFYDDHRLYCLDHPQNKYSIWVANGFWFCSLHRINDNIVTDESVSKFGAIGKILVWWKCRNHINRYYDKVAAERLKKEQELIKSITG